jgi:hypothetical protein
MIGSPWTEVAVTAARLALAVVGVLRGLLP